jgi:predicted acyl esterase
VTTQTSDSDGPGKFFSGAPKTTDITLYTQEVPRTDPTIYAWQLLPTKPAAYGFQAPTAATFPSTNVNTESHAAHHSRENHDWIWFESPVLKKDTRIFGEIKLKLWSHAARKWITFTPSIFDVNPADHEYIQGRHVNKNPKALVAVTRGWLDSRYRNGLDKRVDVVPSKSFGMTIVAKPQDYTFKKGHFIGLNFQTEINEWSLPKPYAGCEGTPDQSCANIFIDWVDGKTQLILPVVNGPRHAADLFSSEPHIH